LWNTVAEKFWAGKIAVMSKCRAKNFYFLFNLLANEAVFPAYMYIGNLTEPLAQGEYNDKKEHLFVDYVTDFSKICPVSSTYLKNINLGVINPWYPANQLVDLVRLVGRQPDGGNIYLGKTLLRDSLKFPTAGDITIGFWSIVNYDNSSVPLSLRNESAWTLDSMDRSFHYFHAGLHETSKQFFRLNELLLNPGVAIARIADNTMQKPNGMISLSGVSTQNNFALAGVPRPAYKSIQPSVSEIPYYYTLSGRAEKIDKQSTR
ncbi:hypothetical protein IE077_003759, partial [Cardiosporidium cionae]